MHNRHPRFIMTLEEHNTQIALCVYKDEKDCTQEERDVRYFERQLCNKSFPRFLRWCKLVEAPTLSSPGGIIPLELWPHIKEIVKALLTERLISILKSRQIGASWTIGGAYVLWYAMSHHGANILLFSKGEVEAAELLNKCRRIYRHLPDYFQFTKVDPDSTTEMGFPVMESTIKALAATESAGISFTASVVVCDEHEEHPYAEANFMAAKPTIDAGGQFISIFTVNKKKAETLAKTLYKGAKGNGYTKVEEGNGFYPMFFPYDVRPSRDETWYRKTMAEVPARELGGLTPDLYMEQNYPRSVTEALSASQTVCVFKTDLISERLNDLDEFPIRFMPHEGIDPKIVSVYRDHHIGDRYIAGTDTSHGKGLDFAVTVVMSIKTGEIVADIFSRLLSPQELAHQSVKMLGLYDNPLWFIETNESGLTTLETAQDLGYKHLGSTKDKRNVRSLGFRTGPNNRPLLWDELIAAMNDGLITVYNKDGLRQFLDVIRNDGRVEAMKGRHDDYPMAVGLAWLKREEVSFVPKSYSPVSSFTFRR